ncbi:MAG: type II secretion system protein GspK [Planctomycetaceae bacterium]|nr:type II secretion system protein GspK [Planctomycetaceae bacterium]
MLYANKNLIKTQRSGVALIFTVIVLVLLTALVYRISAAVSQWKHRMQYMIDYQNARYACESGLKYAIASMQGLDPNCISRPNEPDFSDLFTMSDQEYKDMMRQWAVTLASQTDPNGLSFSDFTKASAINLNRLDANDVNDINNSYDYNTVDINDYNSMAMTDINDMNNMYVRGPYGPQWPYVSKPIEIEFGTAKIEVEILDENAKLPMVWALSTDANDKDESKAAVKTFCEWMQMTQSDIATLQTEFDDIKEVKPFSLALKEVTTTTTQAADANTSKQTAANSRTSRRLSRLRQKRTASKTVTQTRPASANTLDFAKILHSPMVDLDLLAKPVNEDETRPESALKYISLWGTQKVNINSAPRHVLEAAFTYGGDAPDIAQKIIDERRIKPFASIDDLKKRLVSYYSSIEKSTPYITTLSDCYSIRVRATSGVARVCATAAVKKEKDKIEQIGIIIE